MNNVAAVAVAKALIAKGFDESLKVLDLDNLLWAKSLFVRMGFVKRACTTIQAEILEGVCKEADLYYILKLSAWSKNTISQLHSITPLKYAAASSQSMAAKNSTCTQLCTCIEIYIQTSYHWYFWYYPFGQLLIFAVDIWQKTCSEFSKIENSWNIHSWVQTKNSIPFPVSKIIKKSWNWNHQNLH